MREEIPVIRIKDELFASGGFPQEFRFNAEVAEIFDDMVVRSVPMYRDVLSAMPSVIHSLLPKGQLKVADIGCSTGTTLFYLSGFVPSPSVFIGLDSSQAMIDKATAKKEVLFPKSENTVAAIHEFRFEAAAAEDFRQDDCDLVILNYTLQFLPVHARMPLLRKVFRGLKKGGILFLSEKVCFQDPVVQAAATALHERYKESNGYSRLEIARKKQSLENYLVPWTMKTHAATLQRAGFKTVSTLFQWANFATFLAVK